jgi:hypothetical protein
MSRSPHPPRLYNSNDNLTSYLKSPVPEKIFRWVGGGGYSSSSLPRDSPRLMEPNGSYRVLKSQLLDPNPLDPVGISYGSHATRICCQWSLPFTLPGLNRIAFLVHTTCNKRFSTFTLLETIPAKYFFNNTNLRSSLICELLFLRRVLRLLVTVNVIPSSPSPVTLMMETKVPPKSRFLQKPHGVTSQKTAFFIVTAVKEPKCYTVLTGWALQRRQYVSC